MDNAKTLDKGLRLNPQSSDPSNPLEGDLFISNGTPRAAGLWRYDGAAFQRLLEGAAGNLTVTTQTLDYTALTSDDVILMNNTIANTVSFP